VWTGDGVVQTGVITGNAAATSSGAATDEPVLLIMREPGEAAKSAIAAAAEISVPALAMRTIEKKRFRLNQRLDFMMDYQLRLEFKDYASFDVCRNDTEKVRQLHSLLGGDSQRNRVSAVIYLVRRRLMFM
jgi:hypothetical protein